jgi:predicted O-linked N-acetylglucosamine transferase (SPINDLY family)
MTSLSYDRARHAGPAPPHRRRRHGGIRIFDWKRTAEIGARIEERLAAGDAISPWVLLGYSGDEALQRRCAAQVIRQRFPLLPPPLAAMPYRHDKIRLAYISSDVAHHPVATQVVQLIESHDTPALGSGIGNEDDGSRRLVAAFDRFIDAHQQTPLAVAQELRRQRSICWWLNGHTQATISTFSATARAGAGDMAGLPGTTAAPFVDFRSPTGS